MSEPFDPIDVEWAKKYIDQLLAYAAKASGGMRDAALQRADAVLDFIEAWKKRPR